MYYLAKREYDYISKIYAYLTGSRRVAHLSIRDLSKKLPISKHFTTKIIFQFKKINLLFLTKYEVNFN